MSQSIQRAVTLKDNSKAPYEAVVKRLQTIMLMPDPNSEVVADLIKEKSRLAELLHIGSLEQNEIFRKVVTDLSGERRREVV